MAEAAMRPQLGDSPAYSWKHGCQAFVRFKNSLLLDYSFMHLTTLRISVIPLLEIKERAIVNDGTGLKTREE